MIKFLEKDELFPVYYMCIPWSGAKEVNISYDLIMRYERVTQEFDDLQEELRGLYKEGRSLNENSKSNQ